MKIIKKLLVLLISFFLISCSSAPKQEEVIVEEPVIEEKEEVQEEPIPEETKFIAYSEEVEPNNSWAFEGNGNFNSEVERKHVEINGDSASLTSANIYLIAGRNYQITFDIFANDTANINFVIDSEIGQFVNQYIEITPEKKNIRINFYCGSTSYEAKAKFIFDGNNSKSFEIDNFSISSNIRNESVKINQIGYFTNLEKKAVFLADQGNYFSIYNENDEVVFNGALSIPVQYVASEEYLQNGFFGSFDTKGTYYIKTELGAYSSSFVIDDNVYDGLVKDALHFIYTQRCGQAITYEDSNEVYHDACHTAETKVYTTLSETYLDTVGGWHDAGDYGRYVQQENKVIADLLFSYLYTDSNNIEELDEARYGLEWELKLQTSSGSVYNKITTASFSNFILPEYDAAQMYAMYPWTLSTASFAGVMGLAYTAYKDIDSEFAQRCLDAHKKAIDYLKSVKGISQEKNPADFSTGEYTDNNENDERLFAYAVSYSISKEKEMLNLCKEVLDEAIKADNKAYNFKVYGMATLMNCLDEDSDLYQKIDSALKSECDSLADRVRSDIYSYSYTEYNGGSNAHLCDAINKLVLAYYLYNDERYLARASEAIDYIMGLNCLDMCFVYGYGKRWPRTIHHRVANVRGTTITGALAGGVDQFLTEGNSANYISSDTPRARRFVDAQDCFTNVEPAIYYNSPLVLALNLLIDANNYHPQSN